MDGLEIPDAIIDHYMFQGGEWTHLYSYEAVC